MLQFRAFGGVFNAPQGVEHAAGFAAAVEKLVKREGGEGLFLIKEIARTKEPTGAEVGEDQVFVIAQIFFDLDDVLLWVGVLSPKRIRAIALEERLEFQRQRVTQALRYHEVNEALHDADRSCRLESEDIFPKRGEEVLCGRLGLRAVLQVEGVFVKRSVIGNGQRFGCERQEFDALTIRELFKCLEYVFRVHCCLVRLAHCQRPGTQFKNRLPRYLDFGASGYGLTASGN